MVIIKTYKQKLYRCSSKTKHLDDLLVIAKHIYNHCIALHKRYYKIYHKSLNIYQLQKHLTKLKRRNKKYWCKLNSQVIQEITERIDKGYDLFFKERKKGNKRISLPDFKSRSKYKSFTYKNSGWKLTPDFILIQKRKYKLFKDRRIKGEIKTITVKKHRTGDWYICVAVQESYEPKLLRTGKTVGLDFGLKTFLTTSDLEKIESPEFLKSAMSQYRKVSRRLSRKIKGSNNRQKAKLNLSRFHEKITNKRDDFQWKLARKLVERYDIICVETLNIKAMQMMWGRKISDLAISSFYTKLKYLCSVENKEFVEIDRWYPSSKTCSVCGHVLKELSLSQRAWQCPDCQTIHDRDENAAKNIKTVGASTVRLADVRPPLPVAACA
jgi:putative transposase